MDKNQRQQCGSAAVMVGECRTRAMAEGSRVLPAGVPYAGSKARGLFVETNFFEFRNLGLSANICKSGEL